MDIIYVQDKFRQTKVAVSFGATKIKIFSIFPNSSNGLASHSHTHDHSHNKSHSHKSEGGLPNVEAFVKSYLDKKIEKGLFRVDPMSSDTKTLCRVPDFNSGVGKLHAICELDVSKMIDNNDWDDHSLYECTFDENQNVYSWRNRLAFSQPMKLAQSHRWSEVSRTRAMALLYVPFAKSDLKSTTLEVISAFPPIILPEKTDTKTKIAKIDEKSDPKDGMQWARHFWHVAPTSNLSIKPDETVTFEAHLKWNTDKSPCNESTTLVANCDAGYMPQRRVEFKQGKAKFRVNSMGLRPGESIQVKFDSQYFTGLGKAKISVVAN